MVDNIIPDWRLYWWETETAQHIVCDFEALARRRLAILGLFFVESAKSL